jgi:hypothetical protein
MSRYYQSYYDALQMDSVDDTNKHGLTMAIISGISSEGKNVIIGVAFLSSETTENYTWVLKTMLDFQDGLVPKTIMTDFSSVMCNAIEDSFGGNTTHLLC